MLPVFPRGKRPCVAKTTAALSVAFCALTGVAQAQSTVARSQAGISEAQAAILASQSDLAYGRVLAPFRGVVVEKNAFLGNEAKGTGGVRFIGEGHVVRGNYFEKLTGDRERSPLCLMAGIPDTPLNGYAQVKDARIENNLFIGCEHSVAFSYAGHKNATLKPLNTQVSGNYFTTAKPDDLDEHPYMYWEQKDLKKPAWVDQREPAGPTWE